MVVSKLFVGVERVEADEAEIFGGQIQFEELERNVADYGRAGRQRGIHRSQACNHHGVRGPRAQAHDDFRRQRHDQQQVEHDHAAAAAN